MKQLQIKDHYSRKEIEHLLWAIRGKHYSDHQMQVIYRQYREKTGQPTFPKEAVTQMLLRTIALQLYPQQAVEKIAARLNSGEIGDYIKFTSQLLTSIEKLRSIRLPETVTKDLKFLSDAMVGCGLKRLSDYSLKKKIGEYLRETNDGVRQVYDCNCLSGAVINGVLEREYYKVHKLTWGLTSLSKSLVERATTLKTVIELLQQSECQLKVVPIVDNQMSDDEKCRRAITRIKKDLHSYGVDENRMRLVCLKFIKKFGKSGRRKLSQAVHPDVCMARNANAFQIVLNTCSEYDNGVGVDLEIDRLQEEVKPKVKHKRSFHHSDRWKEYVARRRKQGWHSAYYGSAAG